MAGREVREYTNLTDPKGIVFLFLFLFRNCFTFFFLFVKNMNLISCDRQEMGEREGEDRR
jgi:hypothetical protein